MLANGHTARMMLDKLFSTLTPVVASYTAPLMTKQIEEALGVLVGLPLWAIGRAADLAWFEFGNRRTIKGRNGVEKEVGDYALHVQCAWRITLGDKIVTGRDDIFCAPEETDKPTPTDFNWENGNKFDKVVKHLLDLENESRQFTVQSVGQRFAATLHPPSNPLPGI